ncbi:serine/threonine-protein kinase [Methanoregula sp.]|uniref:serine/threonine-protein kinase n=1 Tax=Methanoregula sp. TaxID=2052170 RepID=UPI0023732988|nr:serine/threonine-protein kinase [Methanoregula sp.]MDD1685479.1 protein kinase [Methanoregula sp.]
MREVIFLIIVASCLFVIPVAIQPVSASLNGSPAQIISPSAVTIATSPPAGGSFIFGDKILFSGTNTDSNRTYLFITGPSLLAAGSQIESNDSRISPVTDSVGSTFKIVPVGTDHQWTWTWDTHKVPLNTGSYTIYAVSTPRDKTHLGSAIYDSVAINITEPVLSASVSPTAAKQGDTITISGRATGNPGPGIAIWVIGPNYSDRSVVGQDPDGSFSLGIDSAATHLLPGNYHVFVEHPSADDAFDFDLNGDYLFNNRIRSNIFTFRGNGRLYGEAAYSAFSAAVNGPKNDDLIVPVSFTFGTPPATAAAALSNSPSVNVTYFNGNGTTGSGTRIVNNNTAGPAAAGSSPTPIPAETVQGVPGNSSGNISPAANSGGGLPYGILAGISGIVLLGGIGGAIVLSRKKRNNTVPENSPCDTLLLPEGKAGQGRTGDTGIALPVTLAAGDPASPASPMNAFPEELAGKYTQISPIGSGGFAMVYSAYRVSDNRKVAIKIPIRSNERTGRSFLHEIKVWETMHHPNIVEVTAANILPVPYVEMEFVAGSLDTLAKPVPVLTAARIIRGIAEGIRYAHARRCIHRDIKPQNILLTVEIVPKITDWGISKVLEENTRNTTVAGFSLSYAAPEQIAPEKFGSTDERTDMYQIGAVFYELVTGMIPFDDASMMEMVNEILYDDPVIPSYFNPDAADVEKIILKCLAKDPQQRYQSADELLDALGGYLGDHDTDLPGDGS